MKTVVSVATGLACLALAVSNAGRSATKPPSLKVGLVTQAAALADGSAGHLLYEGLTRAASELGVTGRVLTPSSKVGWYASLASLAEQGFDLVIVGFQDDPAAVTRAAVQFPHTLFVTPDVPRGDDTHLPKNIRGLVFREEQVGYLAGYLAGLMEKRRPGRDVVSVVGGAKIPSVDRFVAGYAAGARRASPRTSVLVDYTDDFMDRRKCKAVGLNQIARGSGVVFEVAGACGFGALEAARSEGVWGVGAGADESYLGPHILTSAVKHEDRAVFETIRSLKRRTLDGGGDSYFTLANGGLSLGRISPRVPAEVVAEVARIRRRIAAGTIRSIPTTVP